jgi:hypothetical protein
MQFLTTEDTIELHHNKLDKEKLFIKIENKRGEVLNDFSYNELKLISLYNNLFFYKIN